MTDKEIIKALECCTGHHRGCNTCAYYGGERPCTQRLEADALKLIRRQQAEIDKLLVQSGHFDTFARNLCGIRLRNGNKIVTFEDLQSYINKQKAEAVREFAEKLKREKYCRLTEYDEGGWAAERLAVKVDDIDKTVNEMFGSPEQVKGE